MPKREINSDIDINTLNMLQNKSTVKISDVTTNKKLKAIFKECDTDKPVDVLKTSGELSKWKNSIENYKNEIQTQNYSVQSGDTIPNIIKQLGYTGVDAKKYEQALTAKLKKNHQFMNDKNWLRAGDTIDLLTDKELKRAGIKKVKNNQPAEQASTPNTNTNVKTVNDNTGLNKNIKTPKENKTGTNIVKNSVERIQQTISNKNQKSHIYKFDELDDASKKKLQKLVKDYKNAYKVEPTIIKNESTGEFHLFFNSENTKNGKNMGEQSTEIIVGNGDGITKNRYYTNGKIVQDTETTNDKGETVTKSKLIQRAPKKPVEKKYIAEALSIGIKVPGNLLAGASEDQKKEFHSFLQKIASQKAQMMKDLNIDNDTYNRFAKMAIGIAIQESGLEKGLSTGRKLKNSAIGQIASDTLRIVNIGANEIFGTNNSTATSKGLTKIKIGDWNDNPKVDKLFSKYGITSGYYDSINGEQSASATIIVLNELAKKVKQPAYQDGIEAANNKFYRTTKKLENGQAVESPSGYMRYNTVSEDDAILYLYNGRAGALKSGNATPKDNIYTHNISRYMSQISISEDPKKRAEALKRAQTVVDGEKPKAMNKDLGWGIGQITFGTSLYTGGVSKNTAEEIKKLENTLTLKGFDANNVKQLVAKVKNGDIAFTNSLSDSELSAITNDDVALLLKYSNQLSTNLRGVSSASEKRKIAGSIDKEFKREYLSNHAQQTYLKDVKNNAIKLTTDNVNLTSYPSRGYNSGAQQRCQALLTQLRGSHKADSGLNAYRERVSSGLYTGFNVEKDKGINTTNSSALDVLLAKNAADTANTLRTSGGCLTGAKQALIGSGAVKDEEMKTFNNAFQLAEFFDKHPERFIEITHIQISDTVAREITAGDLTKLPAGCIVVFGNSNRTDVPGHAAITSGNGQMYADEVDNSNWDNFVARQENQNGKGEHGYFRVFKLNPAYYKLDAAKQRAVKK